MLREIKTSEYHYFKDDQGFVNGEFKVWYDNGQLRAHGFAVNGHSHGECKTWDEEGAIRTHSFFINGNPVSFDTLPYPKTPEELMYFKLKYNLPLLPREDVC